MNNASNITVTIGITAYNRPEFLKQAVHSVLSQSFNNFELIISNDYTDVPVTFEKLGIENDSRITIVNQKQNLGEIVNMNYLLNSAKSEWFVWLADDDLLHPEFLLSASKCISENKKNNIVAFYSNYSSSSNPEGVFPNELNIKHSLCYESSDFIKDYSSRKISLIGCYGVARVDALKNIGGVPQLGDSFGPYSDTIIPILLSDFGNLIWMNEPLVFLRTHEDSLSCKSSDLSAYSTAEVDFLEQLKRVCGDKSIDIKIKKIIANIVKWYAESEWAVLSRDPSLGKITVIIKFIKYQLSVNLSRLSFKYKLYHLIFIFGFLAKLLAYQIYRRFQSILKSA